VQSACEVSGSGGGAGSSRYAGAAHIPQQAASLSEGARDRIRPPRVTSKQFLCWIWRGIGHTVGTATCYVLDSSELEPQWGKLIFSSPLAYRQSLGAQPASRSRVSLQRVKRPERGVAPPTSSAEMRNEWSCTSTPVCFHVTE